MSCLFGHYTSVIFAALQLSELCWKLWYAARLMEVLLSPQEGQQQRMFAATAADVEDRRLVGALVSSLLCQASAQGHLQAAFVITYPLGLLCYLIFLLAILGIIKKGHWCIWRCGCWWESPPRLAA